VKDRILYNPVEKSGPRFKEHFRKQEVHLRTYPDESRNSSEERFVKKLD